TQEMVRAKVPKPVVERYESTRVRMALHCADRTYQVLSISDYDEQQREIGNGSRACFLEEFSTRHPIGKDSSEEDLYEILCSGNKRK
ncbi:MAG TPA: surface-adhesin E family protein, partial [Thermodesulfobacteriota bacterium]|nr:surface-adhesin E family protein [Thermodesulfobacteriota bacterium]